MKIDLHSILELQELTRSLLREFDLLKARFRTIGLSYEACQILLTLEKHSSQPRSHLVKALKFEEETLEDGLISLEKERFIASFTMSENDDEPYYRLTLRGKRKVSHIHGIGNVQIRNAIASLNAEEYQTVVEGMRLFASSLLMARWKSKFLVRRYRQSDGSKVEQIVDEMLVDDHFPVDGEDGMHQELQLLQYFRRKDYAFFVGTLDDIVVGSAGIVPLEGEVNRSCFLRCLFLLPEARGYGLGKKLLESCIKAAQEKGYHHCFLEMSGPNLKVPGLLENSGFRRLSGPPSSLANQGLRSSWYQISW